VKALTAGSEIDAWCTKCKMVLGHRIVALVGPQPARVICMTCNSEHNYKKTQPAAKSMGLLKRTRDGSVTEVGRGKTASRGPKSTQPRPTTAKARTSDWEDRVLGKPVAAFTRYSMTRNLTTGELISHPKFGDGYVACVIEGNKVSVVFRDGVRTLAHAQPA
jgi:hypothetical protein